MMSAGRNIVAPFCTYLRRGSDRRARYTRQTMTRAEALRIFEIDDRRTPEEVRAAYRELVKVWHPDRFANDPGLRAKADRRLQEINYAYAVLQDRTETVEPPCEPPRPPNAATPPHAATSRSAAHTTTPSSDQSTPPPDRSTPHSTDRWSPARW